MNTRKGEKGKTKTKMINLLLFMKKLVNKIRLTCEGKPWINIIGGLSVSALPLST